MCKSFSRYSHLVILLFCRLKVIRNRLKNLEKQVQLDDGTAKAVHELMKSASDSFFRFFYAEQLKMQRAHNNSRRFHPDIIR